MTELQPFENVPEGGSTVTKNSQKIQNIKRPGLGEALVYQITEK